MIKALYTLGEYTGNSQLYLHILVWIYNAISLKLLKILHWNFQHLFEIWFSFDKESVYKIIGHIYGYTIDKNLMILNAF